PQMVVSRMIVGGYRLVQTWFSVYWEPVIVGYEHRTVHVPDPRAVGFGAGIHNDLGLVRLRDSVVEGNTVATHLGSFGGGVSSVLGAVLAEDSRIQGNEANASTVLCSGGGVFNFAGWLRATDSVFNRNRVDAGLFLSSGGGLKNTLLGVAEIRRCEFDGNVSGGGGGIANDYLAALALDASAVTGNRISGIIGANGGGIRNEAGGRATPDRCTIADNEARGKAKGGGFYNQCEQLRIGPADAPIIPIALTTAVLRNCTISGNRAIGRGLLDLPLLAFGGGLYNGSFNLGIAVLDMYSCTIAGNEARDGLTAQGGGLYTSALSSLKLKPAENIPGLSIANLANSLFATNAPSDLHNSLLGVTSLVNSDGYNLDSDGTGAAVTGSSGFRRGDARLAPLARNGGPTSTHALLPGSAARDQGSPDGQLDEQRAPLTDQRGLPRSFGGRRDIGAHESVPPTSFPDCYEVLEGRTLVRTQAGGLLANDFGDAMTLHSVAPPAVGTLNVAPDGAFTYTSPRDYSGVVPFSYQAVDAQGVVGPSTPVEITVLRSLDLLDMVPPRHALAPDLAGRVTLTLDEPVDRFDVEAGVRLEGRLAGRLAFTATVSGHVATLQPLQPHQPGDRITVSLTDRLRAAAGHPLREPILQQFDVGARMGEGRFGPGPELDSPPGRKTLLVDVDGDGDLDLVTTATGNSVWLNDGAGNFLPTGQALTCHQERVGEIPGIALAAGDLTGNGRPDIVVVTHDTRAHHAVWFNEGGGRFRRSSQMLVTATGRDFFGGQTYAPASEVAVGDLDGDSRADILIASSRGGSTQVWFNDGRQRFRRGDQLLTLNGVGAARLADLDGDGRLDIVLAQFGGEGGARVLLNQGGGRFNTAGSPFGLNWCNALAVADLNGDGFPDLCLTRSQFGSEHRIYLNDGAGGFAAGPVLQGGGGFVSGVAVADLNHDGRPDLVMSSEVRPGEVWLGDGAGGFTRSLQTIPVQAGGVDVGDVDGDGDIDLVFSAAASQVWRNNRRPLAGPPPSFTVPKNGRLDFALPGTLLGTASDPDGDPVAVTTLVPLEHRRPTLGLIWMEFGGVETDYEGVWPDGEYVYREVRPVFAHHGTLDLRADGTFTYEPAPGHLGPDSFTYTVTDGISESLPVTVQLAVTTDAAAPEAAGNCCSSRSRAAWESLPGMAKSSTVLGPSRHRGATGIRASSSNGSWTARTSSARISRLTCRRPTGCWPTTRTVTRCRGPPSW
ncbi:MAG TPA: FG-GAP-like repeat-containing protein, partial [Verrucomicrobiota bacterium]|nr:FG-GAP-like repeat-containing protein [Verrucomicrobiota bacterium]